MPTDTSPGALPARAPLAPLPGEPVLDVVIPVFNEEKDLGPCVHRLHEHLTRTFPYPFRITVADNASTDRTPEVAAGLATALDGVRSTRLEEKGRGRALRTVWSGSEAPVLAYMDVDLSTDLNALLPLVAPLISGHSDLAIGTRLARSSRVVRGPSGSSSPAPTTSCCAPPSPPASATRSAASRPSGARLPSACCRWWRTRAGSSTPNCSCSPSGPGCGSTKYPWTGSTTPTPPCTSSRPPPRTSRAYGASAGRWPSERSRSTGSPAPSATTRAIAPRCRGWTADSPASSSVSAPSESSPPCSTWCCTPPSGAGRPPARQRGGPAALRRGQHGGQPPAHLRRPRQERAVRHQAQGLVVFGIGLALTSGSLAALTAATPHPAHGTELAVLITANLAATVLRFLLLRAWVFPERRGPHARTSTVTSASASTSASKEGR